MNTFSRRPPVRHAKATRRTLASGLFPVVLALLTCGAPAVAWPAKDPGPSAPSSAAAPRPPTPRARKKIPRKKRKKPRRRPPVSRTDKTSFEAGTQTAGRLRDAALVRAKLYAQQSTQLQFTDGFLRDGVVQLNIGWRAWLDAAQPSDGQTFSLFSQGGPTTSSGTAPERPGATVDRWANEVSLRALSAVYTRSIYRLEIGLQEISWGETFGVQVVDVVNPRDYRDPLYTDLNWVRVPVGAANLQLFKGPVTVQAIFVPLPQPNFYPAANSTYSPVAMRAGAVLAAPARPVEGGSQAAEFGGKISVLLPFGLDLAALYYSHWNRNVVYEAVDAQTLRPVTQRVETYGLTGSLALGRFVLRQDTALHVGQPLQAVEPGGVLTGVQDAQAVTGADVTLFSDWLVAAQYQFELARYDQAAPDGGAPVRGKRAFQWVAAKTQKPFFKDRFAAQLTAIRGLGNADQWLQPQLTWNAPAGLSLSLRADFVQGGTTAAEGYLYPLNRQDRVLLSIGEKL